MQDSPRPFVFRAMHLDGRTVRAGEPFHFDLNVFETRDPALRYFVATFAEAARAGLGSGRGRAELESVWQRDACGQPEVQVHDGGALPTVPSPLVVALDSQESEVRHLQVQFVTPTELKAGQAVAAKPEFGVLFARARDRVSTLRSLYGDGPLDLDFRAMGERAAAVSMIRCEVRHLDIERRSSRTGQVHPIGGFVGEAEYEGELAEFIPILRAAQWTGVGRQTVWGKGAIRLRREAA